MTRGALSRNLGKRRRETPAVCYSVAPSQRRKTCRVEVPTRGGGEAEKPRERVAGGKSSAVDATQAKFGLWR